MPTRRQTEPGALAREVARIVRAGFEDSHLTQTAVARLAGLSQSQVSRLLRAERVFTVDELDAVCRALQMVVSDVVAEAEARR